jgi:hypothetical protein
MPISGDLPDLTHQQLCTAGVYAVVNFFNDDKRTLGRSQQCCAHSEHAQELRLWLRLLTCSQLIEKRVRAGLRELQKGDAVIAMVGDGVNDAPVLAQAQVSVAMGGGTDLARNQADIVLLSARLGALADGLALSRRALTIIRQNLWWSFVYNFTAVPLAMSGLVTPWMAGIGMSASSLFVVLNALRLQRGAQR